jgi:hypothetical protein
MPRTVSAELTASLARGGDIRHVVGFSPGASELSVIDGEDHQFGLSASVVSVKPSASALDAFEGTVSMGGMSIRMKHDGVARALITGFALKNKAVRVRLGTTEIVLGDFSTIWRGYVDDWAIENNGEVTFTCKDAFGLLRDTAITLGVIGVHPLEAIRQILEAHVPADLWSQTTFLQSSLPSDITHWNVSRYEAHRPHIAEPETNYNSRDGFYRHNYLGELEGFSGSLLYDPKPAWDIIQDLLILLNGVIYLDDEGRIAFRRRSTTTTIDRHFGAGDFFDWGQPETVANIVNRVDVKFSLANGTAGSDQAFATGKNLATDRFIRGDDADSQTDFAYYGSGIDQVYAATLGNDWLRACAGIDTGGVSLSSATDPIDIVVNSAALLGFSGARYRRGFRGPSASGTAGGCATSSVVIASNVATVTATAHWFQTGDYVSSTGWTDNLPAPAMVTVIDANTISVPFTHANATLADGTGYLVPEQVPGDQLSAGTREAYLMIVWGEGDDQYEVVRATACVPTPGTYVQPDPRALSSANIDQYSHPMQSTFTCVRAQQGTIARTIPSNAIVWDITIPVAMRDERLDRYSRGAPRIAFRALLHKGFDLQVGDVISHTQPMFAMEGIDGATSNTGFEVTSVSMDESSSPPCVSLEAEWKFNTTLPSVTVVPTITTYPIAPVMGFIGQKRSIYFDSYSPRFLRATYDASLNIPVSELAISFWLNPVASLSVMNDVSMMCPIGRWESGQRVWKVTYLSNGQIRFYVASHISTDTGSNYVASTTVAVNPNTWHHFLITFISGVVVIYRDGVAMTTSTVGSIPGTLTTGTSQLEIGANGGAAEICRGVFMAHPSLFYGAPTPGQQALFVSSPVGGVPGVPGEPGHIDGVGKRISWWPFAMSLRDAFRGNTLAPAGAGSTDPRFDTRYPPL